MARSSSRKPTAQGSPASDSGAGAKARAAAKPGTKGRRRRAEGDVALVVGLDESGVKILRRRSEDAPVEMGVLRPLTEGAPVLGEVLSLRPRPELPLLFDVKTEISADDTMGSHTGARQTGGHTGDSPTGSGPRQVATDAYRKGWDAIWGRRRRPLGDGGNSVN